MPGRPSVKERLRGLPDRAILEEIYDSVVFIRTRCACWRAALKGSRPATSNKHA